MQDDNKLGGWIVGIVFIVLCIFGIGSSVNSDNSNDSSPESYPYSTDSEDNNSTLEYKGYECTNDCGGHEAGYEWAAEHDIDQNDVDNYSGSSESFREGMQSYVDGY